jgi:hypothetical protein
MKFNQKNFNYILLVFFTFFLLIGIFKYINYLTKNKYIVECFDPNAAIYRDTGSPTTNHTVDIPLTTTFSCTNFCGPPARCAITGQQCMADIDCPGCNPYGPDFKPPNTQYVPGNNDAGKLTVGVTPRYSTLTTDIGTQAKLYNSNKNKEDPSKPATPNFGINTWISSFEGGQQLFDERYRPAGLQYMPNYPDQYSLSGEFVVDGPLPSNAYLHYPSFSKKS